MPIHTAIPMPQLSDTMTEGVMVSWEKKPGERVARGDIVATVETDKAIMDVEVFADGYLAGPLAEIGATVPVGQALGYLSSEPGDIAIAPGERVSRQVSSEMVPHDSGTPIVMPQLSDTMTEGVVVSWEKALGGALARGDIVATVETDKAIMDVEVFQEGFLSGPLAEVGSVIPVGHPMAFIVETAERVSTTAVTLSAEHKVVAKDHAPAAPALPRADDVVHFELPGAGAAQLKPAPRPLGRHASPYARRLAGQMGVDLNPLRASGLSGVITAQDVARAQPSMAEVAHQLPQVQVPGQGRPMNAMEKAVAHAMTASLTLPTFTVTVHARPEALLRAAKAAGVSVTVALAKACSQAMREHPLMNACYQPVDRIVEREHHDFGLAVALESGGLVVPVLRGVGEKSLARLHAEWQELLPRARARKLAPEEYAHPTFTISNMGMFGVAHFTAIPTPGIAAILAIAATGEAGMPLTITADHRVVNGGHVAQYLNTLKQAIEHPETWLDSVGPDSTATGRSPASQPASAQAQAIQAPSTPPAARRAPAIPAGDWDVAVAVIGAGPGGEDCARELAEHGVKVAMINAEPLPGGECLWRGCIPSKAWRAAADRVRDRRHDEDLGVAGTNHPRLVWETLEAHRVRVQQTRGELALKTDRGVKIDVRQGFARLLDDHTLEITPPGVRAQGAPSRLRFGAAVIATGAPAYVPPIPGAREGLVGGGVVTSDTIWDLPAPPRKLGIIGAGVIGVEMAQIFRDFGAEVLMLEAQERPLAEVEEEIAKSLTQILAREVTLVTGARVDQVSGTPGAMKIAYRAPDGAGSEPVAREFACDLVLVATGKRPDTSRLNLAAAGVALEGAAIRVDATGRTSVPHIYAVGDVVGGYMLAHTAGQQGRVAAANLLGEERAYDPALDCGVTFSRPQAAFVGLSAAQARARGLDVAEVKTPMSLDAKAMITGETQGLIKLVVDRATQKIVGVHLLADHADTLIGEAVLMVSAGLTLTQVARAIHPHPTQTEIFGELARRLLARLRRSARNAG